MRYLELSECRDRKSLAVRGGGVVESYCLMDIEFQFSKMERVMEIDDWGSCML